jgi:hypothetical protein
MALTYDAYSKTVKSQQDKESEFQLLKDKYQQDMKAIRQEIRRDERTISTIGNSAKARS